MSEYRQLRSAGGYLIHLVGDDGVALCGHNPASTAPSRNMAGSNWYTVLSMHGTNQCEKCQRKLAQINTKTLADMEPAAVSSLTKAAKLAIVLALSGTLGDKLFSIAQEHGSPNLEACEFEFDEWLSDMQWYLKKLINEGKL
jgi:hypothetical protein